jgi:hypothetical protein
MPDQREIEEFATAWYRFLVRAGEQGRTVNPLVQLLGPNRADVLWRHRGTLRGYLITSFTSRQPLKAFTDMGFNAGDQRDGIWIVRDSRLERGRRQPPRATTYARYSDTYNSWRAVRRNSGASRADGADRFQDASLSDEQKAAIARVALETRMLMEAVLILGNEESAYQYLNRVLTRIARQSAGGRDVPDIGAILMPGTYLPLDIGPEVRVSALGNLQALAVPLHAELAEAAERYIGGTRAMADAAQVRYVLPHERVSVELARGTGFHFLSRARGRPATHLGAQPRSPARVRRRLTEPRGRSASQGR